MSEPFLPYVHYGERVTGYWGAFWPLLWGKGHGLLGRVLAATPGSEVPLLCDRQRRVVNKRNPADMPELAAANWKPVEETASQQS